jgi:hypothetical protein
MLHKIRIIRSIDRPYIIRYNPNQEAVIMQKAVIMQSDETNKKCVMSATITPKAIRFGAPRPLFSAPCHDLAVTTCERCGKHFCQNHEHPLHHKCRGWK